MSQDENSQPELPEPPEVDSPPQVTPELPEASGADSQPQVAPVDSHTALVDDFRAECRADPNRLSALVGDAISDVFKHQKRLDNLMSKMFPIDMSAEEVVRDYVPALITMIKLGNYGRSNISLYQNLKREEREFAKSMKSRSRSEDSRQSYPAHTGGSGGASNPAGLATPDADPAEMKLREAYHVSVASARESLGEGQSS